MGARGPTRSKWEGSIEVAALLLDPEEEQDEVNVNKTHKIAFREGTSCTFSWILAAAARGGSVASTLKRHRSRPQNTPGPRVPQPHLVLNFPPASCGRSGCGRPGSPRYFTPRVVTFFANEDLVDLF